MKKSGAYLLIFLFLISSCSSHDRPPEGKTISVSIPPQKYFVNAIAGDLVNINIMIPPGASHSSYEPTPRQMNLLSNSQAYLRNGYLDFELSWMPRFEAANPSMKIFDLSEGIEPVSGSHDHHHGTAAAKNREAGKGIDPHLWMSPKNARIIAENILHALTVLYPSDSVIFRENFRAFIALADSLDEVYTQDSALLKGSAFIIYHPALAYLARDYGMEQLVLEYDGKEPPPAHIKELIDISEERNIKKVFVQKQFSTDNSKALAREINARIVPIDPMNENWKQEMLVIHKYLVEDKETKQ